MKEIDFLELRKSLDYIFQVKKIRKNERELLDTLFTRYRDLTILMSFVKKFINELKNEGAHLDYFESYRVLKEEIKRLGL